MRSPVGGIDQLAEVRAAGFELVIMRQPQHGTRDVARLRSGQPHHADASASRRRGNGDDGVVEVHGRIVVGRGHCSLFAFRSLPDRRR